MHSRGQTISTRDAGDDQTETTVLRGLRQRVSTAAETAVSPPTMYDLLGLKVRKGLLPQVTAPRDP